MLMFQLVYNLRSEPDVRKAVTSSGFWAPLLTFYPKNFYMSARRLISASAGIKSVSLVELHHSMKLFSCDPEGKPKIWLDFNEHSMTANVLEPITQEPLLVEIMYDSVVKWSVRSEDTVDRCFFVDLELKDRCRCCLGFAEIPSLAAARDILQKKVHLIQRRKVSTVSNAEGATDLHPEEGAISTSGMMSTVSMPSPPPLSSSSPAVDKKLAQSSKANILCGKAMKPKETILQPLVKRTRSSALAEGKLLANSMQETPVVVSKLNGDVSLVTPPETIAMDKKATYEKDTNKKSSTLEMEDQFAAFLNKQAEEIGLEASSILSRTSRKLAKAAGKYQPFKRCCKEKHFSSLYRPKPFTKFPAIPTLPSLKRGLAMPKFPMLPSLSLVAEEFLIIALKKVKAKNI